MDLSNLNAWLWTVFGASIVTFTGLYWEEFYPELARLAGMFGLGKSFESVNKYRMRLAYGALGCIMTVSGALCLFGGH